MQDIVGIEVVKWYVNASMKELYEYALKCLQIYEYLRSAFQH